MRHKYLRTLGRLAAGVALVAAAAYPAAAQQGVPLPQSVIVFPFDKAEGADQSVADTVTNGIRSRIPRVPGYEATTFNPKSPLIRRAVSAGELTQTQLAGPFDAASAAAVAAAAGVDNALVGSVESIANDGGTAKVVISVQLVSARDGAVQKTAGVTGSSQAAAGVAADAQVRLAADDAAAKAIGQIFGSGANGSGAAPGTTAGSPDSTIPAVNAPATPPASQPNVAPGATRLPAGSIPVEGKRRRSNNSGLIIGGLALLGLIIAAAGNGGGGGGGNGGDGGGPPIITFP